MTSLNQLEFSPQTTSRNDLLCAEAMLRGQLMLQTLLGGGDTAPLESTVTALSDTAPTPMGASISEAKDSSVTESLPVAVAPASAKPASKPRRPEPLHERSSRNLLKLVLDKPLSDDGRLGYDECIPGFFDQDENWQARALCLQIDPEIFFPEKGGSTREPKKICASCEVRDDCLTYALEHDERFGVWGGLSERERRRLKRRAV